MKIQVFGTGCAKCKTLYESTKLAMNELGLPSDEIEYVTDLEKIIGAGILSTPALVIENTLVLTGSTNDTAKLKELINLNK